MHKAFLLGLTGVIAGLVVLNIWFYPSGDHRYESKDYVEYIDIGCDDSELEEVEKESGVFQICRGIGQICEEACMNVSQPEVQARLGKGNIVSCRCYRSG